MITIPSRLIRVFISSTFRDFMGERDELVKRVFPELRRRCRARFVELLEVDLRWGITVIGHIKRNHFGSKQGNFKITHPSAGREWRLRVGSSEESPVDPKSDGCR